MGSENLATVGDEIITSAEVLRTLHACQDYRWALERAIDQHLVQKTCQQMGLTISNQQLQQAADRFRIGKRLNSASDTMKWMNEVGSDVDMFERGLEFDMLSTALVKEVYGSDAIRTRFASRKSDLTSVACSCIRVDSETLAKELAAEIEKDAGSFADLARAHSTDEGTRKYGGMLGWVALSDIPFEAREAVSAMSQGGIVGPVRSGQSWYIYQVAGVRLPELTESTWRSIRNDLLSEWLKNERKRTTVRYS